MSFIDHAPITATVDKAVSLAAWRRMGEEGIFWCEATGVRKGTMLERRFAIGYAMDIGRRCHRSSIMLHHVAEAFDSGSYNSNRVSRQLLAVSCIGAPSLTHSRQTLSSIKNQAEPGSRYMEQSTRPWQVMAVFLHNVSLWSFEGCHKRPEPYLYP